MIAAGEGAPLVDLTGGDGGGGGGHELSVNQCGDSSPHRRDGGRYGALPHLVPTHTLTHMHGCLPHAHMHIHTPYSLPHMSSLT